VPDVPGGVMRTRLSAPQDRPHARAHQRERHNQQPPRGDYWCRRSGGGTGGSAGRGLSRDGNAVDRGTRQANGAGSAAGGSQSSAGGAVRYTRGGRETLTELWTALADAAATTGFAPNGRQEHQKCERQCDGRRKAAAGRRVVRCCPTTRSVSGFHSAEPPSAMQHALPCSGASPYRKTVVRSI
jgi:hypothetical protein